MLKLKRYFNAGVFVPLSIFAASVGSWPDKVTVRVGKKGCSEGPIFQTQVAQTNESRNKGLSGRSAPLSPTEAMAFVWPEPQKGGFFWMKDTLIPLSLLYFTSKGQLLSTYEMAVEPDPSHPVVTYPKPDEAQVALEVKAGYANQFLPVSVYVLCIKNSH